MVGLRINMLADPKTHRCDACKKHKQVRFSVYHDDHKGQEWHVCFSCFRLEEGKLHAQLISPHPLPEEHSSSTAA